MAIVQTIRKFNRTYTQRIGVLDESYLGTGRPLNVSRLLFEIGQSSGTTLRELRERLDLDSGYLTRLVSRLEREGLVQVTPDASDKRRRAVNLTEPGRAAVAELDDRSEKLASRLAEPLTPRQRQRLEEALATADLLVRASTVHLREVDPDDPAGHAALRRYYSELGQRFPTGFNPGTSAPEPGAHYVVATSDGESVAYGGIRPINAGGRKPAAEIKRMWVHPEWRGAGLGARMLRHLESLARSHGFTRIVLDTNSTLTEAIALYERAGYRRMERYNDNPYAELFFEKRLPART
ncbi:MarR family transcriptional regulator [Corallococcus coralloides DSM 2259]|uniref:MarR family transcriptional regulator n=1 Tax=Corallococcus coralloides (strain ATCC 25202 / DSM 2259 / NBRC 100086 / M2) TaxID=1144275 RepID=H8MEW7_CORCM|nr:helix-turn-helix domain-containing GNAT family N-acetyltransferase [Corallococcus coralloides]AFE10734.1 MarR family transcriptional regulator [Corallococcus coralloides DSM 2259]